MKILLAHNSADMYGASRSLLRLARTMPRSGFIPTLLLPEEGPLATAARSAGLPVHIQSSLRIITRKVFHFWGLARFFLGLPQATWETAQWIRRENFVLVHTNLGTVVSSALSARLAAVPHVWHIRDWFQEFGGLWHPYARYILAFSQKVICVSRPIAAQFPPSPKVCVLNNGLDLAEFPLISAQERERARREFGFSTQDLVVGAVGRIKFVRKGQEHLLRAVQALRKEGLVLKILLAGGAAPGSEDQVPRMRQLAHDLGLKDQAVFCGELEDPRPAYAAMDVLVLPSAQPEPFGGVVLEAMALERPVVATNIGGSPEQVVPGVTGFLVPPSDPGVLAMRLKELFADKDLRARMGRAGRERIAQELSLSRTVAGITEIYRQVLKGRT